MLWLFFAIFLAQQEFSELKISWKKTFLISSKSCHKQGNDLTQFQIFKPMRSEFHFTLGVHSDYNLSMDSFK